MRDRRSLIIGGACLIAAPAIVKAEWIMPVRTVRWAASPITGVDIPWYREGETLVGYHKQYKLVRAKFENDGVEGFSFYPGIPPEDLPYYYHHETYKDTTKRRELLDG